jgi:type IV pilus assembly protein PilQ
MKTKLEMKTMKPWRVALAGLTLALVSPLTWAAAAIQAITTSQQAGADVVRIELSEPLASLPAGFVVQAPPRIAVDLPGVTNGLARNVIEVNQGNHLPCAVARQDAAAGT